MPVVSSAMTVEEYALLPDDGSRTEFIDGVVVELESGNLLHTLVRDQTQIVLDRLGFGVAAAEVEFRTAAEIRDKVHEYLDSGVTCVWLLYTNRREADIWSAGGVTVVTGILSADCLPGVSIPLETLYRTNL
jgi:hypothetical protein